MNKYFKRSEFACKCGCGFDAVDAELLEVLTDVREWVASPVIINSGCRCRPHNESVNGAENSKHIFGIAADIYVRDIAADHVYMYLCTMYPNKYGIKKYHNRTHIDVRPDKWRG